MRISDCSSDVCSSDLLFQKELDVDETLSDLRVAEGFTELEEVAYVEAQELAQIEGFDEELASELQNRAQEALDRHEQAAREERRSLGVEDAVAAIEGLTEPMLVVLGKAGIKTLDDLADLSTDELITKKRTGERRRGTAAAREEDGKGGVLADFGLSEEDGNRNISAARAQ